ncbi:EG45-like domain containing protein [Mangifera indica]|uniref:EG45-like domain containing protein n=1 Tax=Mangifera indica TaxID=29780 RepID=UPI001CFB64CB|nr:EG45-like domain containing protein [Mangifera indica]
MSSSRHLLYKWAILLLSALLLRLSSADVGTGSRYGPPYMPTACFGNDGSQFPTNNHFAAVGEQMWDNGAICGKIYLVRCLSGSIPKACVSGKAIQVKVVDRAATSVSRPTAPATFVLSNDAFAAIANLSANSLNIEYSRG